MGVQRLVVWVACAMLIPIAAPSAQMIIHAQAGIGDNVRMGAITPVRVRVSNNTQEDYTGYIRIGFIPSIGATPPEYYYRDLPMPPGSEKITYVYVPLVNGVRELKAAYLSERGRTVSEIEAPVRMLPEDRPVLLTVTDPLFGFPEQKIENKDQYQRLGCTPADLPPDALGLNMIDAITISPIPVSPLRAQQSRALRDWVLQGGTLVVDASRRSDFLRDPGMAEMMPFMPTQQEQRDLPIFDVAAPFSTGELRAGEPILSSDDVPLVIRRPYGLGSVTAFAIDPSAPALKRWEDLETLWANLLKPAGIGIDWDRVGNGNGQYYDAGVREALQNSVRTGPQTNVRIGIVVLLTALYAFAVGPGDYFLVKRLGRPKLTWITFPIIVAAFTFAAYYGARWYVGGELAQFVRERVQVFQDNDVTSRYRLTSIFVPVGQRYAVQGPEDEEILPLRTSIVPGDPVVHVYQGDGAVEQSIPIWTQRFFESRSVRSELSPVEFTLFAEGDNAYIEIENHLDVPLSNVQFAYKRKEFLEKNKSVKPNSTERFLIGPITALDGDNTAKWPANTTSLSAYIANSMAFTKVTPPVPLITERDTDLRRALDQGAAVLLCSVPSDAEGYRVNGSEVEPATRAFLQIITYDGVNL